jgi:tetratricopeptide (TPR) repeat protein
LVSLEDFEKYRYKIYNALGAVYDSQGLYTVSLENYQLAINGNPRFFKAYFNTAKVYQKMKDMNSAIKWYEEAIKVNPTYSYAYHNLANLYKR